LSRSLSNDKKKTCIKCKETKGEHSFRRDRAKKGRKKYTRKACRKCEYKFVEKVWRDNNKEKWREQAARNYRRRKKASYKKHVEWKDSNRDLVRAIQREHYHRTSRGKGVTLVNDSGIGYARRKTIGKDRSYVEERDES
jgi:hypothetical protein